MKHLVQIRDVPEDVHRTLKARAAQLGQSLSEHLRRELERIARSPTPAELRERFRRLESVDVGESPADAVRDLREGGEQSDRR
jgi:plasmid stability protein